ncbi:unnamed protein product, partial [Prorocentrum cordatum]
EFIKAGVSKEELASEAWKPTMDKLASVKESLQVELARIDRAAGEMLATIRNPCWDGNSKALREELKALSDSQKDVDSHAVVAKRHISDAKAQWAKKQEVGVGKKRKSTDDAPQMEVALDSNLGPMMQVVAAETRGKPINVSDDLAALSAGKITVVAVPERRKDVEAAAGWKACESWMRGKVELWGSQGAAPAFGSVVQPAVLAQIRMLSQLEKKDVGHLFRTAFIASGPKGQALFKVLYGAQCFIIPRLHSSVSPAPYGMAECRLILEGEEVVVGAKMDVSEGGLAFQADMLKNLSGHDMLRLAKQDNNFCCVLKEGDFAVLPTGFVYVIFRNSLVKGIRWGMSPNWEGELASAEKTVSAAIEAYPGIRGTMYEEWWKWLQANAAGQEAPAA